MSYKVVAYIDELDYTIGENLTDEQLEAFLYSVTRKQEFKNVRRFDIIQTDVEESDGKVHLYPLV